MKRVLAWLGLALPAAAVCWAGDPALVQNQTVYLLPMSYGFDQFLATELSKNHVLAITTDPKKATVILTDRLGEPLEQKLKEYYDPPPPPKKKVSRDLDKKDQDSSDLANDPVFQMKPLTHVNSFGGNKGGLYLVNTQTRQVIWSTYSHTKRYSSDDLHRMAAKVTHQLMKDAAPPTPVVATSGQ